MRRSCSFCPTSSHSLMSWIPLPTIASSTRGQSSRKPSYCVSGAEPHHVLDARPVVPTSIEHHDLSRRGEVRDVALHVELRLLAVGGRGQRDDPEHARAHPLGEGANRPPLAGRVAPLEDDDHPEALVLDPLLKLAQLGLQLAQGLLVLLVLHLRHRLRLRLIAPTANGMGDRPRANRLRSTPDSAALISKTVARFR